MPFKKRASVAQHFREIQPGLRSYTDRLIKIEAEWNYHSPYLPTQPPQAQLDAALAGK
jgi:hypothetical protein